MKSKPKAMFDFTEISNWLFIDIESASEWPDLQSMAQAKPHRAKLWTKRCEYLRRRFIECERMTDDELYIAKAGLHPEFARIVCASVGVVRGDDTAQIITYAHGSERELVDALFTIIGKCQSNVSGRHPFRLCGHNIKRFDIPFIYKKAVIHGVSVPDSMHVHKLKPWDMPFVDTSEIWSFGAWQESFASLDMLADALNLPSPKEDMAGDQVQDSYWKRGELPLIAKYCANDVLTVINAVRVMSGMMAVTPERVTYVFQPTQENGNTNA